MRYERLVCAAVLRMLHTIIWSVCEYVLVGLSTAQLDLCKVLALALGAINIIEQLCNPRTGRRVPRVHSSVRTFLLAGNYVRAAITSGEIR